MTETSRLIREPVYLSMNFNGLDRKVSTDPFGPADYFELRRTLENSKHEMVPFQLLPYLLSGVYAYLSEKPNKKDKEELMKIANAFENNVIISSDVILNHTSGLYIIK